jgi:hypothetical protein
MFVTLGFPVAAISQVGVFVLLAGSLLAAILGLIAFAWAMGLLWRENNPQGISMRGQTGEWDDAQKAPSTDVSWKTSPKKKLLSLVSR